MRKYLLTLLLSCCFASVIAQDTTVVPQDTSMLYRDTMTNVYSDTTTVVKGKAIKTLMMGADQMKGYLTLIKGKSVAIVCNQTSMVGKTHLVDTLLKLKVKIQCVFSPEHGFRGEAAAGEEVDNAIDEKTHIPIISLYGTHLKPTKMDLDGVDVVIYDIQDVGARFYTYISTMQNVMEACAENNKVMIILDRPNPNGFYIDGPVLDKKLKSFVGMSEIPIVYALTPGELARMIVGEKWIKTGENFNPKIIKMKNYSHKHLYNLPINPSPNLTTMSAIYLYPSLCWFEGTAVSVGRGTDKPFEQIGYPGFNGGDISFTPASVTAAPNPPYLDTMCDGLSLSKTVSDSTRLPHSLNLALLLKMYKSYPNKTKFFNTGFDKLAGISKLREQIQKGATEEAIRKSWQNDIAEYKKMRKKYLLYEDFEK